MDDQDQARQRPWIELFDRASKIVKLWRERGDVSVVCYCEQLPSVASMLLCRSSRPSSSSSLLISVVSKFLRENQPLMRSS